MFTVNGVVTINGKEFYRIDDLSAERVGFDFINNPAALVSDKELAERIVALLNAKPTCPHGYDEKILGGYARDDG